MRYLFALLAVIATASLVALAYNLRHVTVVELQPNQLPPVVIPEGEVSDGNNQ